MKNFFFTCRCILLTTLFLLSSSSIFAEKYYIYAGVKGEDGKGRVYISEQKQTPSPSDYAYSSSAPLITQEFEGTGYLNYSPRIGYYFYAQPDEGYCFDHWEDASGNFLSNENPMFWYVLRKSNNSIQNYKAVFKETNQTATAYDTFYRIKSATSDNYLTLVGEKFNFQTVVGSASSAYNDQDGVFNRASSFIKQDILLTDNYQSIPSTVFALRKSSSDQYYDIVCQGVSLKNFTTGIFHGTNAGDQVIKNKGIKTESSNNGVKIKMFMTCSIFSLNGYLYESSGKLVASRNESSEWILEPLTEASMETSYFGAAPLAKVTDGTKYYTTMYTAFPYKLMDGVKAYYVQAVNDNKAKCVEISDVVPAYTAVILECNSTDPKENRLVPNTRQVPSVVTPEENLLKGVIDIDNGTTTNTTPEAKYRTANNQETMRVLNVNSKGVLGFYKYGGTYMNTNKAYLDVSSVTNAKSFTLEFVEGEATGVSEVRTLDPQTIRDGYYYDLQGRRVENPTHGLYIINGKKVIIK